MPAEVLEVTKRFMRDPVRILVKKEELTLEGIRQFYVFVEKEVRLHFLLLPCITANDVCALLGLEIGHVVRSLRNR